jgi:hypothetical protein
MNFARALDGYLHAKRTNTMGLIFSQHNLPTMLLSGIVNTNATYEKEDL